MVKTPLLYFFIRRIGFAALFSFPAAFLRAELEFPAIFNHHMVLQREMPVPVFGTDLPGTAVTVEFGGQTKQTVTDDTGVWKVVLDPMQASAESRELRAVGSRTVILQDILVGEVWLGCGQSNMVISVKGSGYSRSYPLDTPRPLIRFSPVAGDKQIAAILKDTQSEPRWNPEWRVCTPENIPTVGGILFAFAVDLQEELDVPVGIINRAIGGNPVRSFVDQKNLKDDPIIKARIQELADSYDRDLLRAQEQAKLWRQFAQEYTPKERIEMGFRKARGLESGRVGVAKLAQTEGKGWGLFIKPMRGTAFRGVVWDQGESGAGMLGNRAGLGFCTRALIREWRKTWPDIPFIVMQKPSGHGRNRYGRLGVPDDVVVPLPEHPPKYPWTSGYKAHEYLSVLQEPNTWLVNTSDLILSVHPARKDLNGQRAAEIAISEVYKTRKIPWRAPEFKHAEFKDGRAVVHFDGVGDGFKVLGDGRITGFVLSGRDQVFHWADATVVGDTLHVSSPQVPDPVAVRYAFGYKHVPWANLFGANDRPVLIFRSDDWVDVP